VREIEHGKGREAPAELVPARRQRGRTRLGGSNLRRTSSNSQTVTSSCEGTTDVMPGSGFPLHRQIPANPGGVKERVLWRKSTGRKESLGLRGGAECAAKAGGGTTMNGNLWRRRRNSA